MKVFISQPMNGKSDRMIREERQLVVEVCEKIKRSDKYGDDVLLWADFKKGCVYTNCADDYYNYSITFDDFIKFAEFIKKTREEYGK